MIDAAFMAMLEEIGGRKYSEPLTQSADDLPAATLTVYLVPFPYLGIR